MTGLRLLFLDIDGVLNDHVPMTNGYCGIQRDKADRLNWVLYKADGIRIVLSSAWRYGVYNGHSTLEGLEYLLMTHGIDCRGLLHGITAEDPERFDPGQHKPPFDVEYWKKRGLRWRAAQIEDYVKAHAPIAWTAVDDLPLDIDPRCFVQTDGAVGLTSRDAESIVARLALQVEMQGLRWHD